jgi:hypothetical protein
MSDIKKSEDKSMIHRAGLIIGVISAVALLGGCEDKLNAAKKDPPKQIQIAEVVKVVSNSLAQACSGPNNHACDTLSGVDLTLHTEVDKDGRIGISIFGIGIGGHREKDSYHEFSVHLVPPGPQAALRPMTEQDVSKQLSDALKAFADASLAAHDGKFPLTAQGFYLELGFTVQYGADANSSGISLIPIFPDVSGKIDRKDVQTIRLTFGKTN